MAEKDVNVKVVLHPPGSNPPFHFESNDVPIDKKDNIYFSNCGKLKGFVIHYNLDDTDNPNFRFPTRANNGNDYLDQALWAQQAGGCPTQQCGWDVFKPQGVDNGGATLIVKNKNEIAEGFFYTLRVTDGATWLDLDPSGTNQNGGEPLIEANVMLLGGAGLVAGALIGTYLLAPALY